MAPTKVISVKLTKQEVEKERILSPGSLNAFKGCAEFTSFRDYTLELESGRNLMVCQRVMPVCKVGYVIGELAVHVDLVIRNRKVTAEEPSRKAVSELPLSDARPPLPESPCPVISARRLPISTVNSPYEYFRVMKMI
ncbi:hypothetical protein Tcan_18149 [Toxocara canis]|uniref:Uncharacterized protein n=1 Tax=Toxocara canis TaxID=6265 RepID=A0A0B2VGK6_TOXCA|nr:hypothetical protein Tcan_18149 [Toxocara canis]